jgi:hypothetical protein
MGPHPDPSRPLTRARLQTHFQIPPISLTDFESDRRGRHYPFSRNRALKRVPRHVDAFQDGSNHKRPPHNGPNQAATTPLTLLLIMIGFGALAQIWRLSLRLFVERDTLRYHRIGALGSAILGGVFALWFIVTGILWTTSTSVHATRYGRDNFLLAFIFLLWTSVPVSIAISMTGLSRRFPNLNQSKLAFGNGTTKSGRALPLSAWIFATGTDALFIIQWFSLRKRRPVITIPGSEIRVSRLDNGKASSAKMEVFFGQESLVFTVQRKFANGLEERIRAIGGSIKGLPVATH